MLQKSLAEGFGLTVTEAMWKQRAVVATRVGGIADQITHDEHGLLVDDPHHVEGFGASVEALLDDGTRAARLGTNAHERVLAEYLGDRHLERWGALFEALRSRPVVRPG